MIEELRDCKLNSTWVNNLDEKISSMFGPKMEIGVYGSRDSFLDVYQENNGKYPVRFVKEVPDVSASKIREQLYVCRDVKEIIEKISTCSSLDESFRLGVMYASTLPYPTSFGCVDAVVQVTLPDGYRHILIGRKAGEKEWVLPGGFVDPSDEDKESAALREVQEETGLEGMERACAQYAFSLTVDDYRYRGRRDKIMTSVVVIKKHMNTLPDVSANDDLEEVGWFRLDIAKSMLYTGYRDLLTRALNGQK